VPTWSTAGAGDGDLDYAIDDVGEDARAARIALSVLAYSQGIMTA
jgi:hypothetical protein